MSLRVYEGLPSFEAMSRQSRETLPARVDPEVGRLLAVSALGVPRETEPNAVSVRPAGRKPYVIPAGDPTEVYVHLNRI